MPDLGWWLENFKESAFRLERCPRYNMPEEAEMLAAFKRGEKVQLPENHPWPPLVKRQCSAGKVMQRARVVSRPPTEYERFELSLYPHSIEAGEQICVYERGSIPEIFRYEVDFWLFDNHTVYILNYDAEGHFLGTEPAYDMVTYRRIRDLALERSIPLADFTARAAGT
ncbi:MAG TPA: hypothetical protein VJ140_16265 [Actinomycetota bacterium]|nr:hypothetical protein [Actinomycetota bacterium]